MSAASSIGRWTSTLITVLSGNLFGMAASHAQNVAPVISGTPPTAVAVGNSYDFRPTATDANGDPISFSASGLPRWAKFDRQTGRVYGAPSRRSVGTSGPITIVASDGRLSGSLPGFTIKVVASGTPWISGTPPTTVAEQELYGFLPDAGDPEGDPLKFSIVNKPAWATFTATSGLLSGIPPAGSAGTYSNVQISVSDGQNSVKLPAFSIAVAGPTNRPPTIAGTPATSVKAGLAYLFRPVASDPDGQALRFSVMNLPTWATFDAASGALSGTATATDVGTYPNIVIAATDGQASATLAPFSVTVNAVTGSASLSWVPPTENVDGTPLTNLAGYRVVYGQSSASLTQQVEIPNPGITSAMIEDLASGTWYFAVKAFTAANVQSDLSNLASKTIN